MIISLKRLKSLSCTKCKYFLNYFYVHKTDQKRLLCYSLFTLLRQWVLNKPQKATSLGLPLTITPRGWAWRCTTADVSDGDGRIDGLTAMYILLENLVDWNWSFLYPFSWKLSIFYPIKSCTFMSLQQYFNIVYTDLMLRTSNTLDLLISINQLNKC